MSEMQMTRFKPKDMLLLIRNDRLLGDELAQIIDIDFFKNPEKYPQLLLDFFLLMLEKIGYSIENCHVPPRSAQMKLSAVHLDMYDDSYWTRMFIIRHLKHFYRRFKINYQAELQSKITLGDILAPTPKTFALLIGTPINIIIIRDCVKPYIDMADSKILETKERLEHLKKYLRQQQSEFERESSIHEKNLDECDKLQSETKEIREEKSIKQKKIDTNKVYLTRYI